MFIVCKSVTTFAGRISNQ